MTPGRRDPSILLRRLTGLDAALDQLERHAQDDARMLRADLDRQWAVLHGLQIASQALLDLASHLAAAAGRDVPDYASAIQAMGDLGIFSPEVCRRCRPIAGFRNVLVHEYLDVDLEVVASVLANGLVDMRAAAAAIRAHLAAGS